MIPISELLSSSIRHAICAKDGHALIAVDLGSIESRVLGWFTACERINQVFADNKDTYKDFATTYFGIPYDQVTKEQRTFSKPPVLGAGFGLGWRGMIAYAEGYGIELDEEKAKRVVEVFRTTYHEIPTFWKWIELAVHRVVTTGQPVSGYRFTLYLNGEFLCIRLPSNRDLWYFRPQIKPHETPWGEIRPTFSYMGLNEKNQWVRIYAHAGLICENCTQAIARDFLAYGMKLISDAGMNIVLHVHDEIVCEELEMDSEYYLEEITKCMTTNPPWAPDILLGASGYIAKRYRKG